MSENRSDLIKVLEDELNGLKEIPGYPNATKNAILQISDPPQYTASPNPFLAEFLRKYAKLYDPSKNTHYVASFIGDVVESRKNKIYNAHAYHTKIPPQAILKYIEHYTEPGDLVFDGFCGSGMTGVAAAMASRRAVLLDLSPIATLIAYNYNTNFEENYGEIAAEMLLEVEKECEWMYETTPAATICDNSTSSEVNQKAIINYVVWSDVFLCPHCAQEYTFWDVAVDQWTGKIISAYKCPSCGKDLTKKESTLVFEDIFDSALNTTIKVIKEKPVLINYLYQNQQYEKAPDARDLGVLEQIASKEIPYWYPSDEFPAGDKTGELISREITHVHLTYEKRALWVISAFFDQISKIGDVSLRNHLLMIFSGSILGLSKRQRYHHHPDEHNPDKRVFNFPNMIMTQNLYIGSLRREYCAYSWFKGKLDNILAFVNVKPHYEQENCVISTQSMTDVRQIPENTIDYIFTDPPFGFSLMYSELSFIWEAWLKAFTNTAEEAIMNKTQKKQLSEYDKLMYKCFKEMYRILKPNHWLTVMFKNTKASIWNAIQQGISRAGFLVAQVAVFDKVQKTYNQTVAPATGRENIIINAYKPHQEFSIRFLKQAGENMELDFVTQHLERLPIIENIERTHAMLYSRLLAEYLQKGFKVQYSAPQFLDFLRENFVQQGEYWFLENQLTKTEF